MNRKEFLKKVGLGMGAICLAPGKILGGFSSTVGEIVTEEEWHDDVVVDSVIVDSNITSEKVDDLLNGPVSEREIERRLEIMRGSVRKQMRESRFLSYLNKEFAKIEKEGKTVTTMFIPPTTYAEFRMLGAGAFNESSRSEFLQKNIVGHIWTADIKIDKNINGIKLIGS